jgi:hypothetical protein
MSLESYRWFYRDVVRLPDKAAWIRASQRETERRQEVRQREARRAPEDYTGLPDGVEQIDSSEGDGDVTVYPEVTHA